MKKRILIVGGVAGGASAAARIRRMDSEAEIIMFEQGEHVSFSSCALPYHLSGTVANSESLVLMSPEKFLRQHEIQARTHCQVTAIDRNAKQITVKNLSSGEIFTECYDKLVLSPGASPILPKTIAGIHNPHVFTVRNVTDIRALKKWIDENQVKKAAVIGGGFIGVEVAENLSMSGISISLIEGTDQIMAPFDYDMVQTLHKEMLDHGISLHLSATLTEIQERTVIFRQNGQQKTLDADVVIMAIGVRPETALAQAAGLTIGETGGIWVNHNFQTSDPDIYAVGDAIESFHSILGKPGRLALAGPAQRQARSAADHICGRPVRNKGFIASSCIRIFEQNAASTGLNEKAARAAGIPFDFSYIYTNDKVGLMPDAHFMAFKLLFEVPTGKILGAQAIGKGDVARRIDVIASMITMGADLEDLKELELCYSPVFGTAKDVVNIAALSGLNLLEGRYRQVSVTKVRELAESGAYILDVREPAEYELGHIKGAHHIPLSQLKERMDEVPKDVPVYVHCRSSQRSYYAVCRMQGRGYKNLYNLTGSFLGICLYEYFNDQTQNREPIVTAYNFK